MYMEHKCEQVLARYELAIKTVASSTASSAVRTRQFFIHSRKHAINIVPAFPPYYALPNVGIAKHAKVSRFA